MSLQPGALLENRYLIVRAIKAGGMGAVYEAKDTRLDNSPCAVKEMLDFSDSEDGAFIRRKFEEEKGMLSRLNYPGIPRVRDFFLLDRTCYIVMDLVSGVSLEQELAVRQPSLENVVDTALQVLDILAYLHGLNPPLVHRDIKPGNIIRDEAGRVWLVDFGLACVYTGQARTEVGTLGYAPLEQISGAAEPRSDLFALGATMLHLITGVVPVPFSIPPALTIAPALPPALAEAIDKVLANDPKNRFANAREMSQALKAALPGDHRPLSQVSGLAAASAAPPPAPLPPLPPSMRLAPLSSNPKTILPSALPTRKIEEATPTRLPPPKKAPAWLGPVGFLAALGAVFWMSYAFARHGSPQTSKTPGSATPVKLSVTASPTLATTTAEPTAASPPIARPRPSASRPSANEIAPLAIQTDLPDSKEAPLWTPQDQEQLQDKGTDYSFDNGLTVKVPAGWVGQLRPAKNNEGKDITIREVRCKTADISWSYIANPRSPAQVIEYNLKNWPIKFPIGVSCELLAFHPGQPVIVDAKITPKQGHIHYAQMLFFTSVGPLRTGVVLVHLNSRNLKITPFWQLRLIAGSWRLQ